MDGTPSLTMMSVPQCPPPQYTARGSSLTAQEGTRRPELAPQFPGRAGQLDKPLLWIEETPEDTAREKATPYGRTPPFTRLV